MSLIGGFVAFLYIMGFAAVVIILIYLIVRRVEEKDKETFEKRKN
ncbi:MAG: hypothetical protein V2I37_12710 [Marinilabiliaceae bacterium]|jgi:hypothetical protein|nr:hypothetical protein [Marinilabiliaceae bacterium]